MPQTIAELEIQALQLSSLEHNERSIENAWIEEVLGRQEAVRSGKMRTYTLEEVLGHSL